MQLTDQCKNTSCDYFPKSYVLGVDIYPVTVMFKSILIQSLSVGIPFV